MIDGLKGACAVFAFLSTLAMIVLEATAIVWVPVLWGA